MNMNMDRGNEHGPRLWPMNMNLNMDMNMNMNMNIAH